MKDKLFLDPGRRQSSFEFDEDVAAVFDDMLKRSIPFYFEIQNMIADLTDAFAPEKGKVCDLGCSTGTTIKLLSKRLQEKAINFEGYDNSVAMLKKAEINLAKSNLENVSLHECDLNQGIKLEKSDVVIMNLVLQFVRPENRERLLSDIYSGLNPSGCLILVEKTMVENEKLNTIYTDAYHDFKRRNLYTDQEIASKRQALENVLVPNQIEENKRLLTGVGFECIEVFFCWFNFCGLIAVKD
jgi:tRNA (cmo5U34)-methyltransferase